MSRSKCLFSFSLDEKETKNQVKNMLNAPHGILRISRSAKSLNSRFTSSLLTFLTGLRSYFIQHLLKIKIFLITKNVKIFCKLPHTLVIVRLILAKRSDIQIFLVAMRRLFERRGLNVIKVL